MKTNETRCGFIAIIGRPNVGKSTLLNRILGQKISITSKKPQTTRHKILGIKTNQNHQIIFVDTPGLHKSPKTKINVLMIKSALKALRDIDAAIFVVDAKRWSEEDQMILQKLMNRDYPVYIALNKIDQVKNKEHLLPLMKNIQDYAAEINLPLADIIPISAKLGDGLDRLENEIKKILPSSPFYFPKEQKTDRSNQFIAAELIREKLIRFLGEEVPHAIGIEINKMAVKDEVLHIHAIIWVERKGQKAIVIGKGGSLLKKIGQLARIEMEDHFKTKVYLNLWVKIKENWTDDEKALLTLGFGE